MSADRSTERDVLFVSPVESDHAAIRAILARSGWQLQWEPTGRLALARLHEETPAVVLTAHRLPDISWKELLHASATQPHRPAVVVYSPFADEQLWSEVLEAGANDLLSAPFDPAEVRRVLAAAWDIRRANHGRPEAPGELPQAFADLPGLVRRFLETSVAVCCVAGAPDGTMIEVNPALAARLGYSRGFLLNFVGASRLPFTLDCRLEVNDRGFLLLGESPVEEDADSVEELMRLNSELVLLAREVRRESRVSLARASTSLQETLQELIGSYRHLHKIREVLSLCESCGGFCGGPEQWRELVQDLHRHELLLTGGYCERCQKEHRMEENNG